MDDDDDSPENGKQQYWRPSNQPLPNRPILHVLTLRTGTNDNVFYLFDIFQNVI